MKSAIILSFAFTVLAQAAMAAKSYQVTGTVKSVTGSTITVVKGKENFEIELGGQKADSIKAGDKITVKYSMTATEIEKK